MNALRLSRKAQLIVVSLLIASSLILSACGDDTTADANAVAVSLTQTAAPTSAPFIGAPMTNTPQGPVPSLTNTIAPAATHVSNPPTLTCETYNPETGTTPVTITWTSGAALQVWDSTGVWYWNAPAISPLTISSVDNRGVIPGIVPGRTVIVRSTDDFVTFSLVTSINCTPPTQPAPTSTNVPPVSASVQPCLTDGQMQDAFGFTDRGIKPVNTSVKSEGENCKWTLQAVGVYTFKDVPFVKGWELTAALPDQSVRAYYGDGVKRDIMGATFRQLSGYDPNHWVQNADRLLAHEFNFGWSQGRDPHYLTINGNLTTSLWNNYDGKSCPTNTVQVAGLVGGEPNYWNAPTWPGGAWVFAVPRVNNNPSTFLLLTAAEVPGTLDTHIDYWNSSTGKADVLDNWQSMSLADASYHCH